MRRLVVVLIVAAVITATCGSSPGPGPTPSPATQTALSADDGGRGIDEARAVRRCVGRMPLRIQLGQLLVPLATPGDLAVVADLGARGRIGGVVLLGAPTRDQVAQLDLADAAGLPLMVASDEEGGRVQRLAGALGALPSAAVQATRPVREVRRLFRDYGRALADYGVDVALAPVVDVGGGPGIGDRAFAADPAVVTRYARAVVAGYRQSGIVSVIKHFPGHGRASADTHYGLATTPPIEELERTDLVPYRELLDEVDVVMVGHLLVPGLTERRPTSLSRRTITGLLRRDMGFDGVVITDALGMGAVARRWSNPEAALLALQAGADLAMIDSVGQTRPTLDHLARAVRSGELPRRRVVTSVVRSLELRDIDPCALGAG
jgi:beta-N-acetylhexosaminidase